MTVLKASNLTIPWKPLDKEPTIYIETGSGYGHSLDAMLCFACFTKVIGIEINKKAAEFSKEQAKDNRLAIINGSSLHVLPEVIDPTQYTVFFLDSHYETNVETSWDGVHQCPLLTELRIILGFQWKEKPLILIDDYAIFMSNDWWKTYAHPTHKREQWPTIQEIFDTFKGLDYKWNFTAATNGILYCW